MVVITLQYINVSNQHVAHLKPIQCYMSIMSQKKNKQPKKRNKITEHSGDN